MSDDPLALIRAALAGANTFVWEWNLDNDHLVDMDEGLSQLGYASDACPHTQEAWNRLIHPEDLAGNQDAYLRHANGYSEVYEHVYRIRAHDGSWRWTEERGRIVERHADGRPRRMLGTQTDITAQRAAEAAEAEARERLEQARRDTAVAKAANDAKTVFLSRISHELRTPLNAVLGFAQLMEIDPQEPPKPNQQRRLGMIRESGEHLLHMIADLLDLTRIEAGGLTLTLGAVSLDELSAQAVEMMASAAARAQVQLHLQPADQALVVHADRTRLRQVLLNLLSNAIKYNRPGGHVLVRMRPAGTDEVAFDVEDSGQGIDAADLGRIFEPFHRGRQAEGTVEGAGIGLSVTQALVQMMAGRIAVASTSGQGSTFSVVLPAYRST